MNKLKFIISASILLLVILAAYACSMHDDRTVMSKKHTAQERLTFYKNEEKKGNLTANNYADIGELYYGFKKSSLAILYFEKGLALSPLNSRLLANRKKTLNLCNAEVIVNNSNFYEQEILGIKIIENLNIVFTVILMGSLICYFLTSRNKNKAVVQKHCKATALFSILMLLLVYGIHRVENIQTYGILRHKTSLYNGPSHQAKLTYQWDEGYQIKIVNSYGLWLKVESYNHQSGWLKQGDLHYLPI
ncbi:SH3 domain-containing protein [Flavobacterium sp.]|uniref:SH3 domain-containing protein n=1 Tax=Flavobacterium sp. TaxID=239 RepID=UPI00286A24FE|nr:SH3 domain-containing protein [Flavobacterium sp.]